MYGAVMGLAGLGLAWRAAATAARGVGWVAEFWLLLAALALLTLLPAYLLKLVRHPEAVRAEFTDPAQLGYCATLPVGMTLVAAGLQPYSPFLAKLLWWPAVVFFLGLQLWGASRLLRGGVALAQVNGGWLILFVAGIVVPSSGLPLGYREISAAFFAVSTMLAPFVLGLVLYRTIFGPPLPDAARPTSFILLVPPALIYANGLAVTGGQAGLLLEAIFYCGLILAAGLIASSTACRRWPFGAPWWAFTFPLDALAIAALRHASSHRDSAWEWVAYALVVLATVVVLVVLARTFLALGRGRLLAAPA